MSKISIVIPCFNQTQILEKNLRYLKKQTFKNFEIVILDDRSTENYQEVIPKFPDLKITYIKNEKNLGAINNIFNSIFYKTDSPYKISLHEDDILHPQYLEKAVEILDRNEKIAFVATLAEWFKNEEDFKNKFNKSKDLSDNACIVDKTNFLRKILDGKHIMFGSIVYRNSILDEKPDFEKFDVLCDRPFLISLLKNDLNAAIIEHKAMFVRDHGVLAEDNRFKNVTEEQCLNLMNLYKDNLPKPINLADNKKLLIFSTNNLINAYSGLKNKKINFYRFIKIGKNLDLIDLRYINKIGVAGILKVIFGEKIINKSIKLIKR